MVAHIVRSEDWGDVDLDVAKKHVFVRENWEYAWQVESGQPDWTPKEKTSFHRFVDRSVWVSWSHRALIRAQPDRFAKRSMSDQLRWSVGDTALTLSFDVKQVRAGGQWSVTATKVDPTKKRRRRAEVDFERKTVDLFSTDVLVKKATRYEGDAWYHGFNVHAHEFGHTLANPDEYEATNANFDDTASILNVGRKLRARHLHLVCSTLARMVTGCSFVPIVAFKR